MESAVHADDSRVFSASYGLVVFCSIYDGLVEACKVEAISRPGEANTRRLRGVLSAVEKEYCLIQDNCCWIIQVGRLPVVCWVWRKDGIVGILCKRLYRENWGCVIRIYLLCLHGCV